MAPITHVNIGCPAGSRILVTSAIYGASPFGLCYGTGKDCTQEVNTSVQDNNLKSLTEGHDRSTFQTQRRNVNRNGVIKLLVSSCVSKACPIFHHKVLTILNDKL